MIQIGPDYLRVYSELLSREYRYIKIYDVDVCLVRILPGKGFVSLPVSLGIGMSITKVFARQFIKRFLRKNSRNFDYKFFFIFIYNLDILLYIKFCSVSDHYKIVFIKMKIYRN